MSDSSTKGGAAAPVLFPDTHAAAEPDRPAYIMAASGVVVTYGELVESSRSVAALLWSRGLRHGDCVAILMENNEHLLKVAWAVQRIGLRLLAVSTRMTASEVAYILADSGARAIFTSPSMATLATEACSASENLSARFVTEGEAVGFELLPEALAAMPHGVEPIEREGVDLLYSSGTTGRPKGVESALPLAPIGTPPGFAHLFHTLWGIGRDSVYLSPAPLYHAAPLRVTMTVHRYGGTVIVMEKFDATRALELIERHRVTETQMVPTMLIRILKLPNEIRTGFDVSSLRCVVHAAAPCPAETKRAWIDWVGPIVREYYSATENYLFTELGSEEWLTHPGSVGRPLVGRPHILDDEGVEVPVGVTGTIWSEDGLDFTYLNDSEKTAAARNARGWTTVGDLGFVDVDGFLYLSDRRSDLILAGGVNVYPQEAENVLVGHPDVQDAAVFGIPHEEMGEVVHGVIQLRAGLTPSPEIEEKLVAYCREHLAGYKCPRRLDFSLELPRTPTGKLFKRVLRDQYSVDASASAAHHG